MFDTQFFLFIFSQSEFYSKSSVYFVRRQYDMTEKIRIVPDLAKQKKDFFYHKKMGIFSRPSAGKRGENVNPKPDYSTEPNLLLYFQKN